MPGGGKALKYAEDILGVHSVYELATATNIDLTQARTRVADARRAKYSAEELYRDAELDFITDLRGQHSDLSQTAFDKLAKEQVQKAPHLRTMRGKQADSARDIDLMEAEIRRLQNDLDLLVARMTELGGYLGYLAELKRAETVFGMQQLTPTHAAIWPGVSDT